MPTYTPTNIALRETLTLDGVSMAHYEQGDLTEHSSAGDYVWTDGWHKVTILPAAKARGLKLRTKTFKGETAWMDAERLWNDAQFWVQREAR